jgi:hypothetical protein
MTSPTAALLWEIWGRHRSNLAAIALLTVAGRLLDIFDRGGEAGVDSPLMVMLAALAFMILLGVFNYTESGGDRGLGRFPRRLFTLPLTSLRLVALPVVAGIASIEFLYLLWMGPLSRGGSTSAPFIAVLLAALVVFYLWTLWALERFGSVRLIVLGIVVGGLFFVGLLPTSPPTPPPPWRSEPGLAALVAGLAGVAFLLSWRHVVRLRGGDDRPFGGVESVVGWISAGTSTRRRAFATPAAAHFWFEWRSAGLVLPTLVSLMLLLLFLPMSWRLRGDADDSFRLLLFALMAPIAFSLPVGIAFSKPSFWTEDMAVPAFVAVRPLSAEDLVAIKMKVAALSAVLAWAAVLLFATVWLSLWGNVESLSQLAIQLWALHGRSTAAVIGIAMLVAVAGMFLTWRFLVFRMWSGLSGRRGMLVGSIVSFFLCITAILVSDAGELPAWLLEDPARLAPLVWIAALAVAAKYWTAAYTWRRVTPRYVRAYLLIWLAGTASLLAVGLVVWNMARMYVPLDVERARSAVILLALLAVPIARIGLAPSSLMRNRHRS